MFLKIIFALEGIIVLFCNHTFGKLIHYRFILLILIKKQKLKSRSKIYFTAREVKRGRDRGNGRWGGGEGMREEKILYRPKKKKK